MCLIKQSICTFNFQLGNLKIKPKNQKDKLSIKQWSADREKDKWKKTDKQKNGQINTQINTQIGRSANRKIEKRGVSRHKKEIYVERQHKIQKNVF